ncbi:MAG: MBL fold metallo-hydrolase [Gracilibacter sp. BRH_c7a]|nr:MAG: MBL fold metallo-hydrolase [Gracilibacter sp. BRH_c7a]
MKDKFKNLDDIPLNTTLSDLFRWRRERKGKIKDISFRVPQAELKQIDFLKTNKKQPSLTWVGHATFLIQLGGLNILTDPVWAQRLGTAKRLVLPGLMLTELPQIDVVLISHNHYDHLDFRSLRKLAGDPTFLIPKGLGLSFSRKGLKNTQEFQWWEDIKLGQVSCTFVPAQHWSKRSLWDTNRTLWGGWMIKEDNINKSIYFVGDSGYFRGFQEIANRFTVDIFLAPIGCYEPEWFMEIQHITPEQAVQAYVDVGANLFIPMHYESFQLGDDTPQEALDRLIAEWGRRQHPANALKLFKLGETLVFNL